MNKLVFVSQKTRKRFGPQNFCEAISGHELLSKSVFSAANCSCELPHNNPNSKVTLEQSVSNHLRCIGCSIEWTGNVAYLHWLNKTHSKTKRVIVLGFHAFGSRQLTRNAAVKSESVAGWSELLVIESWNFALSFRFVLSHSATLFCGVIKIGNSSASALGRPSFILLVAVLYNSYWQFSRPREATVWHWKLGFFSRSAKKISQNKITANLFSAKIYSTVEIIHKNTALKEKML